MISPNEDLVDAVSGSCDSCVGVKEYSWDTGSSGEKIDLAGRMSARDIWTSFERNANGLVVKMVEGDDDDDASTVPSGARVTFYRYDDSSFPGLVTEVRRLSELKPSGTCNATTTTDCKRTINSYSSAGLLESVQEIGFTHDEGGDVVGYDFTRSYGYDGKGRLVEIAGPRTDTSHDNLFYTYYSDTDGNRGRAGMPHEIKRQTGASIFLVTTLGDYDRFGSARLTEDPNGNLVCRTFEADRGLLTLHRVAMAGQSSCGSPHGDDLVTEYSYDDGSRVTRIDRPSGNCVFYDYDGWGRLERIKPRDNCNPASAGDTMELTYSADGLELKVEYKNSSNAVMFRREMTYHDDRRLASVINPEVTSVEKTYSYEPDGMLRSITGEDGVGKTEWIYDALNRVDERRRYTGSSTFDTWNLTPGVQLMLPTEVEDDEDKSIEWVHDDLNRTVTQVTPDAGTRRNVYDEAGNLVLSVVAAGTADEFTIEYTYDPQNRILSEDWDISSQSCPGAGPAIQYVYDAQPGSCPTGAACTNLAGRLAYVKTKMFCDDSEPDETFDQETYYAYDDAGRITETHVVDDGGRVANTGYTWDKSGNPLSVTAPSGFAMSWQYGSGENSDREKPVTLSRDSTLLVGISGWHPFGPLGAYAQANGIWTVALRDLAYRPTALAALDPSELPEDVIWHIIYDHDDQGRLVAREFNVAHSAVQDARYTYDWLDRVLCDSEDICQPPYAKSDLTAGYSPSGNRQQLVHTHGLFGNHTYTTAYVTGTNRIEAVTRDDSVEVAYAWDGRGARIFDIDDHAVSTERWYEHDGRGRTIVVDRSDYVVPFTVTNVYDERNRRVFNSLVAESIDLEAHWFFYYDIFDRLIEVKHVSDVDSPSQFSLFQFYWMGQRPVAYYQVDYPGPTTSRRFIHADEMNRPLEVWSWPTSGSGSRVWAINPDLFGWDDVVVGGGLFAGGFYQPLRFPGQIYDPFTEGVNWGDAGHGCCTFVFSRPALHENRARTYDPFTGTYLSVDPLVGSTWDPFAYASQSPVMSTDPTGEFSLRCFALQWIYPLILGSGVVACSKALVNPDPVSIGICAGVLAIAPNILGWWLVNCHKCCLFGTDSQGLFNSGLGGWENTGPPIGEVTCELPSQDSTFKIVSDSVLDGCEPAPTQTSNGRHAEEVFVDWTVDHWVNPKPAGDVDLRRSRVEGLDTRLVGP